MVKNDQNFVYQTYTSEILVNLGLLIRRFYGFERRNGQDDARAQFGANRCQDWEIDKLASERNQGRSTTINQQSLVVLDISISNGYNWGTYTGPYHNDYYIFIGASNAAVSPRFRDLSPPKRICPQQCWMLGQDDELHIDWHMKDRYDSKHQQVSDNGIYQIYFYGEFSHIETE